MPHFTREELEASANAVRGAPRDTSRDALRHVTYQPPPAPRDVRRDIYNAVYSRGRAMSVREIADALGVVKSPWLRAHIERLVMEGYLVRIEGRAKNGAPMFFYEVVRG